MRPTTKPPHKHTFHKAYKYDDGKPQNNRYNKGSRWILMWACTGCPYKVAYDLTHTNPRAKAEPPVGAKE